jgi:osmoprotectant transport system permease protein
MAGVRTAAVWVIGTATLSTPIGQTSLGNYIFAGLQTQNWVFVLFGCVAAAVLALLVDQLLALIERGYSARSRARMAAGAAGLLLTLVLALVPNAMQAAGSYAIGAKPFGEQYILAALMQDRLRATGLTAGRRDGLGSAVILDALAAGDIDAYVEYTGTVWANQLKRTDVPARAEVLKAVADWLKAERGIVTLGGLGFENAYALAMKRERALALGVKSIGDLARHAPTLSIAGDYEFFSRPEWKAIRETYGLNFGRERTMQAELMYPAAGAAEVDVISAYTSDGRIAEYDLVVLEDPKQAIPPYDAILLVSPRRADDQAFLEALRPLVGAIDVGVMREANRRASTGATPEAAARWLDEKIGR